MAVVVDELQACSGGDARSCGGGRAKSFGGRGEQSCSDGEVNGVAVVVR